MARSTTSSRTRDIPAPETTAAETPEVEAPMEPHTPAPVELADHVPGADPSDVTKVNVKTSGAFILLDPWTGSSIDEEGATVVRTQFIVDELASGRLVEA